MFLCPLLYDSWGKGHWVNFCRVELKHLLLSTSVLCSRLERWGVGRVWMHTRGRREEEWVWCECVSVFSVSEEDLTSSQNHPLLLWLSFHSILCLGWWEQWWRRVEMREHRLAGAGSGRMEGKLKQKQSDWWLVGTGLLSSDGGSGE